MVRPRRAGDQRLSGPEPGRCMSRRMARPAGPRHGQASRPVPDVRRGRRRSGPRRPPRSRRPRAAVARPRPARSADRSGSRSRPRSAAPSTGGASSRGRSRAGATAWTPAAIRASKDGVSGPEDARRPGPRPGRGGPGAGGGSSRRPSSTSSSASRSRIARATASPPCAAAKTTGDRPCSAVSGMRPYSMRIGHVDRAAQAEVRRARAARAGPRAAAVAGPDRGAERGHAEPPPPPQSPEMSPSAASRAVRPSGRDPRRVDARAADHADAPAALGAGPERARTRR